MLDRRWKDGYKTALFNRKSNRRDPSSRLILRQPQSGSIHPSIQRLTIYLTPDMAFECDDCSQIFPNGDRLRRHRSNEHSDFPPFSVDGKEYTVTTAEGKFHCPFESCGRSYKGRDALKKHLKDAHKVVPEGLAMQSPAKSADKEASEGMLLSPWRATSPLTFCDPLPGLQSARSPKPVRTNRQALPSRGSSR